eukprot:7262545-Karenia_brevis.AAC.1
MVRMYLAVDKLRQSDAFRMGQPQSSNHVKIIMPHMASLDQGKAIEFKLCRNYYNHYYNKAIGPVKGFMRLLARTKVTLVPMGQVGHTWLE